MKHDFPEVCVDQWLEGIEAWESRDPSMDVHDPDATFTGFLSFLSDYLPESFNPESWTFQKQTYSRMAGVMTGLSREVEVIERQVEWVDYAEPDDLKYHDKVPEDALLGETTADWKMRLQGYGFEATIETVGEEDRSYWVEEPWMKDPLALESYLEADAEFELKC